MPATPLGIRAAVKYVAEDTSEVAYNILHFARSSFFGTSFAAAVAELHPVMSDGASGSWNNAWRLVGHSNANVVSVTYYNLVSDPVTEIIERTDFTLPNGGSGNPALPYQVALGVSLRTLNASRRGRGRAYLPYLGGASLGLIDGKISVATRDALDVRFEAFRARVQALIEIDDWQVYSRLDNTMRDVESVRIGVIPDTIRRRRNKRGENYSA